MFFFEGETCPVCGAGFAPDDDIVTCPDCGAPFHRGCYKDNGGCLYGDKHAEGYAWERTVPIGEAENKAENELRCQNCGAKNLLGAKSCANCGAPLTKSDEVDAHRESNGEYGSFGTTFVVTDGEMINGVPVGDLKRFIGSLWVYYVPFFLGVARRIKKISFNIIALFMHGLWFIWRKMYGIGILLMTVMLITEVCQAYYFDTVKMYYDQLAAGDSSASMRMVTEQPVMAVVLLASAAVRYGIMLYSGIWGNRAYMKHCVRRVKALNKTSRTADEFNNKLDSKGGVAFMEALLAAIAYFGAEYYIVNILFK